MKHYESFYTGEDFKNSDSPWLVEIVDQNDVWWDGGGFEKLEDINLYDLCRYNVKGGVIKRYYDCGEKLDIIEFTKIGDRFEKSKKQKLLSQKSQLESGFFVFFIVFFVIMAIAIILQRIF